MPSADVRAKFDALTSAHLDDDVHRELTDVVQSLEHTRVRALTALLAQARPGVRE